MGEKLEGSFGCLFALAFFGFGILQLIAGWAGIAHSFGSGWAVAAVVVALMFRFTLPIVVGAFLCAKDIWGWHWFFAAIFAAPGLLFMVPAFFGSLAGALKKS
jgi:hypothetical protein